MTRRPTLPLEARIAIEQGRDEIFKTAAFRFNLLFSPIVDMAVLSAGLSMLDVPAQRMPATLTKQLQEYSSALFDVEAKQHASRTHDPEQLRTWLEDLAFDTENELKKLVAKDSLNFHLHITDRSKAVTEGLRNRVTYWVELKTKQRRMPVPDDPITPVGGSHISRLIEKAVDSETVARILAGHSAPKAEQPKQIAAPRPLGEQLDEIVLSEKSLSHEQLAERIGISRASYFQVKAGRAGSKSIRKVEIFLSGLQAKKLDSKKD